jgi:hypothetical protein
MTLNGSDVADVVIDAGLDPTNLESVHGFESLMVLTGNSFI